MTPKTPTRVEGPGREPEDFPAPQTRSVRTGHGDHACVVEGDDLAYPSQQRARKGVTASGWSCADHRREGRSEDLGLPALRGLQESGQDANAVEAMGSRLLGHVLSVAKPRSD